MDMLLESPQSPTNSLPEKDEQNQDVMREVESGREFAQVCFNSPEERESYENATNCGKKAVRIELK